MNSDVVFLFCFFFKCQPYLFEQFLVKNAVWYFSAGCQLLAIIYSGSRHVLPCNLQSALSLYSIYSLCHTDDYKNALVLFQEE